MEALILYRIRKSKVQTRIEIQETEKCHVHLICFDTEMADLFDDYLNEQRDIEVLYQFFDDRVVFFFVDGACKEKVKKLWLDFCDFDKKENPEFYPANS